MPFWKPGEQSIVLRLASGDRQTVDWSERNALELGWKAEAGHCHRNAREELLESRDRRRKAFKAGTQADLPDRSLAHSLAEAASKHSARWDCWEQAIDLAHNTPEHFNDSERQSNADVWRAAAVLGRRNTTVQRVIQQAATTHATERTSHHSPKHHGISVPGTKERMQIALATLEHTTRPHAANSKAMAEALLSYICEHHEDWSDILHKCKHRLRLELQRGEEVRDSEYWLPISRVDVMVNAKHRVYPCRIGTH